MATERLPMRQIREILRQKWALGLSHREVARSLGLSSGAVGTTVLRARAAGLDWAQVGTLTETALEARLYGRPEVAGSRGRPHPDFAYLHAERRKPGVTLELLHLEYLEQHPDGYRYSRGYSQGYYAKGSGYHGRGYGNGHYKGHGRYYARPYPYYRPYNRYYYAPPPYYSPYPQPYY